MKAAMPLAAFTLIAVIGPAKADSPSTTFDPAQQAIDGNLISLRKQACDQRCDVQAVVSRWPIRPTDDLLADAVDKLVCLPSPVTDTYVDTELGVEYRGILLPLIVSDPKRQVEYTIPVLARVDDADIHSFPSGKMCLPKQLLNFTLSPANAVRSRQLSGKLLSYRDAEAREALMKAMGGAVLGAMVGAAINPATKDVRSKAAGQNLSFTIRRSLAAAGKTVEHTARSLTNAAGAVVKSGWVNGRESEDIVRIGIGSLPAGAELLRKQAPTGQITLVIKSMRNDQVNEFAIKYGQRIVPLGKCLRAAAINSDMDELRTCKL